MKNKNPLKARLKNGEVMCGAWCEIPSPGLINAVAATGMDFVIIDMEHGNIGIETAGDMIRAAEVEGCSPVVRVSKLDESLILSALDADAFGVIVPHIESRKDAEAAIAYAKYHPMGQRGFSPFTRAGRYSLENIKTHASFQNDETALILMLEGKEGISSVDDVLSIENISRKVDAIYIGAYDLSQALGMPGQIDHPEVMKAMKECVGKIRAKGLAAGGYVAKNKKDIEWMTAMGMQFITLLPDCGAVYAAYKNMLEDFRLAAADTKNK